MKRSELGPGRKSIERGSTFSTRAARPRRGRPKPRGRPSEQLLERKAAAPCWLARFSHEPCGGPLHLCHLIDAQRLRDNGVSEDDVWDERAVVNGCEHHHYALDKSKKLRVRRDQLPLGLERFAAEHGLVWSLEREYGLIEDEQTRPQGGDDDE